jgi:hypothetical protein
LRCANSPIGCKIAISTSKTAGKETDRHGEYGKHSEELSIHAGG